MGITSEIQTLGSSATRDNVSEPINETIGTIEFTDQATASDSVVLPVAEAPADELVKSRPLMQWLGTSVAIALLIWAVGAAVLLLRMIIGWIRLSRILNRAEPIRLKTWAFKLPSRELVLRSVVTSAGLPCWSRPMRFLVRLLRGDLGDRSKGQQRDTALLLEIPDMFMTVICLIH